MCGSINYGKCDVCGKEANLTRKYFKYGVKCECHSPEHFEIVEHCSECVPVAPEKTTIRMQPIEKELSHIERMRVELKELYDKYLKASQFLNEETAKPKFTDEIQRSLLNTQVNIMYAYITALEQRIKYDVKKAESK